MLDCDNTLWGGIVGELGASKIHLGNEYPGKAFLDFQKTIIDLYKNGVIITLVAKIMKKCMGVFKKIQIWL